MDAGRGVYIPFMIIAHDFDEDMTLWVFGRWNWSWVVVELAFFSLGRLCWEGVAVWFFIYSESLHYYITTFEAHFSATSYIYCAGLLQ